MVELIPRRADDSFTFPKNADDTAVRLEGTVGAVDEAVAPLFERAFFTAVATAKAMKNESETMVVSAPRENVTRPILAEAVKDHATSDYTASKKSLSTILS